MALIIGGALAASALLLLVLIAARRRSKRVWSHVAPAGSHLPPAKAPRHAYEISNLEVSSTTSTASALR